jgi:hypothetical protein
MLNSEQFPKAARVKIVLVLKGEHAAFGVY